MLFETFATRGLTPKKSSVGKVMRVPEPTIVLMIPAPVPASATATADQNDTRSPYSGVTGCRRWCPSASGRGLRRDVGQVARLGRRGDLRRDRRSGNGRRGHVDAAGVERRLLATDRSGVLGGLGTGLRRLAAGLGKGLGRVLEHRLGEGVVVGLPGVDPLLVVDVSRALLVAAQGIADALEGVGQLRRDDPHLVRVAARNLREHLEVLVGQQLLGRLAAVARVEDLLDGPGLALGLEDAGLGGTLGPQDLALLLTLCGEDRGLLEALGREDGRTAVTF